MSTESLPSARCDIECHGKGAGAGPVSTLPPPSNFEPWQGHLKPFSVGSTTHPRCVQTREMAAMPSSVETTSRFRAAIGRAVPLGYSSADVIEAVGEGLPSDTVAAISNLVERLGPQVREILPMGQVSAVSLGDDEGLVLDTRYFDLFGVRCALAIARYEDFPYPGLAKKAIESVVSSMDE